MLGMVANVRGTRQMNVFTIFRKCSDCLLHALQAEADGLNGIANFGIEFLFKLGHLVLIGIDVPHEHGLGGADGMVQLALVVDDIAELLGCLAPDVSYFCAALIGEVVEGGCMLPDQSSAKPVEFVLGRCDCLFDLALHVLEGCFDGRF